MKMITNTVVAVVACIAIQGCSRIGQPPLVVEEAKPMRADVTETKCRQLASDHVNSTFKEHVWKTDLGDRKFYNVSPQHWHSIETMDNRLVLKYGASRGQEFTVSMNLDGTGIKVEHHGYALR